MPHGESALANIVAAGNDPEALAEAIEQASFLDATPGDDRQKLRAARTRLKKMLKDEEVKKQAAVAKSAADRSPHTKESYDTGEFAALIEKYEKLNWKIISKPGGATVKPDDFYTLYGFHMVALNGENTAERPMWTEKGGLDFEGRAKWDAWAAVKGTKPEKAKLEFVRAYYEFPVKALYTDTR
ncbi:hypothetical protein WJX75_004576 [Coccomyxa subellipsoidea]|uniref:ACB domain-containing protein n=1 Tax=Coccomyxa subellipsoidea TaxID=248742 RepID=A0ABR2YDW2_9CHLO